MDDAGFVCTGLTRQLVSGATLPQWAPNEALQEWPSFTTSSMPSVAETVGLDLLKEWNYKIIMIRLLLPAKCGELRPAHKQVEPCRQYVQAARRGWGRLYSLSSCPLLSMSPSPLLSAQSLARLRYLKYLGWCGEGVPFLRFGCWTDFFILGWCGERVPLCHRRSRRACRLKSSAVEVQLHGKVRFECV